MTPNPMLTIIQLENALNNLQNSMVKEDGSLALDATFLKHFDSIMIKLQETRALATNLKDK
jgi:hypothetical protein